MISSVPRALPFVLLVSSLIIGLAPSRAAAGAPEVFVAASVDGGDASDAPVMAVRGQKVMLYAVVARNDRGHLRYTTAAPALKVRGRRVPSAQLTRPGGDLVFAWSMVEPHPHHAELATPNPGNPAYSNAVLFGAQHGRWLGYDTIEYHETPLAGETGPLLAVTRATPSDPNVNVHDGLGTMRFKVSITAEAWSAASPGAQAREGHGISRRVMRVSFRSGDDLPGRMSAFFNVPNVFGSAGKGALHQTDMFQGADCADVIVGALRSAGVVLPYTSVKGLLSHASAVTPRLVMDPTGLRAQRDDGQPGEPVRLRFGADVRSGDVMLIDYLGISASPRDWDYVAVVAADAGVTGELDPADLVMHMGYLYGLTSEAMSSQGPAIVQFLRWNRAVSTHLQPTRARVGRSGAAGAAGPAAVAGDGTAP